MLLAANKWDDATEYSYRWAMELDKALSFTTVLEPDEVTREKAQKEIPKHDLIVFYDHGSETALVSQNNGPPFLDTANVDLVADKEVYTMCCLAAKSLGVEAWKRGAVWWGYTEVYGFVLDDEDIFCEQANYGLIVKLNEDLTWEQAYAKSQERDVELIEQSEDVWTRMWLQRNMDSKVVYTEDSPPPDSTCRFRRLALKLFGRKLGWKL